MIFGRRNNETFAFTGQHPKSKQIFADANEKIENFTKFIFFVSIKMTFPGVMLPTFVISYLNYFTTDLGGEAFTLAFPIWYVWN